MPTIIEVNLQTGEQVEREMTAEEIAALPKLEEVEAEAPAPVDPVQKLRTFLAANPDVAALLEAT
jgi:hypothetical protein